LSKGGFEIAMEGILDVRFVETSLLVDLSTLRRGHRWKGGEKKCCVAVVAQSGYPFSIYYRIIAKLA
jgi:hypothetical protein